ncbi:hypothetical protein AVEN_136729-1 [Araneus ventricosus]|uniref:Uncharacterized protein n=1 Tax=Araneus ventricosus TaxID=182803 RepID=A0A4Y2ESE9_ARAVE|nr:hypothetical protein AVEN_136729-1 [Araneus ventricosus]
MTRMIPVSKLPEPDNWRKLEADGFKEHQIQRTRRVFVGSESGNRGSVLRPQQHLLKQTGHVAKQINYIVAGIQGAHTPKCNTAL